MFISSLTHKTSFIFRSIITRRLNFIHSQLVNSFLKMNTSSAAVKPPNVLIYTGKECDELFNNFVDNLHKCLHVDKYVFYELKTPQVLTTPWKEYVVLLIVCSIEIEGDVLKEFVKYVKDGGKLLVHCSNFNVMDICKVEVTDQDFVDVKYKDKEMKLLHGKYNISIGNGCVIVTDVKNNPVIAKVNIGDGVLIVSSVHLVLDSFTADALSDDIQSMDYNEKCLPILKNLLTEHVSLEGFSLELPKPTPGYIIFSDDIPLEELMKRLTISEISIEKHTSDESQNLKVPLFFETKNPNVLGFDKNCYYSVLKTDYFGKIVVFFPVVTSTMYPAEHLSDHPGVVVIANRQLSGKGRGENVWLSPEGCAMFTLHFPLMLSSPLGQRLSVIQHMCAVAVVHSVHKILGCSDIGLHVKWPNDIYYEKDKKIGGVLVNTTVQGNLVHVYAGIGVNVSNQHPTICINRVIQAYNAATGKTLSLLKIEEVIAATLTELEQLTSDFATKGPDEFLKLYYKYWIHKDQHVSLLDFDEQAVVHAIDDYGFLIVKTNNGEKLALQPNENRFDMMKNLIVMKKL